MHLESVDILHLIKVPQEWIQGYERNEKFLSKTHHMLAEGTPQCPESGHLFLIIRGILNMLLGDEEAQT